MFEQEKSWKFFFEHRSLFPEDLVLTLVSLQQNNWSPKGFHLPISKPHSILVVPNLKTFVSTIYFAVDCTRHIIAKL